jgi:hypothetical protein
MMHDIIQSSYNTTMTLSLKCFLSSAVKVSAWAEESPGAAAYLGNHRDDVDPGVKAGHRLHIQRPAVTKLGKLQVADHLSPWPVGEIK